MTDSPRWERESQEDLSAPVTPSPAPEADESTVELDMRAAGLQELSEPPEYEPTDAEPGDPADPAQPTDDPADREPRLAAARESLTATRLAARESLAATRERTRQSLHSTRESLSSAGESLSDTAVRVGRWVAALDRRPEFDLGHRHDPIAELTPGSATDAVDAVDAVDLNETIDDDGLVARFPLARRGYDRLTVDRHLAALEAELAQLRATAGAPMSINEEIERLGEQAASILVTAHDTASETARRAQEQATRAVTEAAGDAERITAEAQRRLHELDEETDAVWRERERLLADVREVSATLATLADAASERFPADEPVGVGAIEGAGAD